MSERISRTDVNIRAARYGIAQTRGCCPCCGEFTRLVAIVMPPGHETLSVDCHAPGEIIAEDLWEEAPWLAFLFYVVHLPSVVRQRVHSISPFYRFTGGDPAVEGYWANHCEHCDSLWPDQELFGEPGDAFLPTDEAAARAIWLHPVPELFAASSSGYAPEPGFFD